MLLNIRPSKIPLALHTNKIWTGCKIKFSRPEIVGFTGGTGHGETGLYGNHMSSIVKVSNNVWRIYQTKRVWLSQNKTTMEMGYIDTSDLSDWPDISENFTPLVIAGLPSGVNCSQPYVLKKGNKYEIFFWIHGGGMIRYVKGSSDDGIHFEIANLKNPCLYHPSDYEVRSGSNTDSLLTVKDGLVTNKAIDKSLLRKISNDATSINHDEMAAGVENWATAGG